MFQESGSPLLGIRKAKKWFWIKIIFQLSFFYTNFVIINLDLGPDRIRTSIEQLAGSGFDKTPGYGSKTVHTTVGMAV